MDNVKSSFLAKTYLNILRGIDPATQPLWGKMNFIQMVEHMSDSFRIANGKDVYTFVSPVEHIPKLQAFLMSDKPFRENTTNPFLPEMPPPPRYDHIEDALNELQQEIDDFFEVFDRDKTRVITNPIFGDLNYEMWIQLLHKHALHHLRQFGAGQSAG